MQHVELLSVDDVIVCHEMTSGSSGAPVLLNMHLLSERV